MKVLDAGARPAGGVLTLARAPGHRARAVAGIRSVA